MNTAVFKSDSDANGIRAQRVEELALRILSFPLPVVVACYGHPYPMGAFLMLAADVRFGVGGEWRIGMDQATARPAAKWARPAAANSRSSPWPRAEE